MHSAQHKSGMMMHPLPEALKRVTDVFIRGEEQGMTKWTTWKAGIRMLIIWLQGGEQLINKMPDFYKRKAVFHI
jgi:hypothetical protein